jgi:hypothetical protein
MRHEYVVVSAAVAWVVCMGATEPHDKAISRIDIGFTERFMTLCRKPPENADVNRIRRSPVDSVVDNRPSGPVHGTGDHSDSPC